VSPLCVLSLFTELMPLKIINQNKEIIEKYNHDLHSLSLLSVSTFENNTNKTKINYNDNYNENKNVLDMSKNPFDEDPGESIMKQEMNKDGKKGMKRTSTYMNTYTHIYAYYIYINDSIFDIYKTY
jgi:peptidyl-tRNA hydrolase